MAAIDGVSLKQLDSVIREHASSANRFYSDLQGKNQRGSVHDMNLLDPRDLVGEQVQVHGHAPASRAAHLAALRGNLPSPVNIFSVLDMKNKSIGQVTNLGVNDVGGSINRFFLNKHLNFLKDNPEVTDGGPKERHTFVTGTVSGGAPSRMPKNAEPLAAKDGRLYIPGKNETLWEGSTEAGNPTRSDLEGIPSIGRRAAFYAGKDSNNPERPSAWILR